MCPDARVEVRGQFTVVWIFSHHVGPGNWTFGSLDLTSAAPHWAVSLDPDFIFWDKVSLPGLGWPQIYYIAQASVKLFKFLKFYLVYIFVCFHACLSVYAHWCTLVHACIYCCCVEVRGVSFFFHQVGPGGLYQAWQRVPLPTSLLTANIDRL